MPIPQEKICKFFYKPDGSDHCSHYQPADENDPGLCDRSSQFQCIVDIANRLPYISHSGRMNWARCRYKWYLARKYQVRQEKVGDPLVSGIILDEFISYYINGRNFKSRFEEIINTYQRSWQFKSRVHAIIKAWYTLGITIDQTNLVGIQQPCRYITPTANVIGYTDVEYTDHLLEFKMSSNPDYYTQLFNITSQCSTYFLCNPEIEYIDMMIVRLPGQRTGTRGFVDEDFDGFKARMYSDIISRPSYYFTGWKKEEKTFGKRFWRTEFPLDVIERDYEVITQEILTAMEHEDDPGSFYQNFFGCHVPFDCEFLPICQTGIVSDEIYEPRKSKR